MSILRFRNVTKLLEYQIDGRLIYILKSISCLTTRIQAQNNIEASQVIEIVKQFRVAQKHLIITIPKLDIHGLQNKTINFNVMIKHQTTGKAGYRRF